MNVNTSELSQAQIKELVTATMNGDFLERLFKIATEVGQKNDDISDLLVALHNNHGVDIIDQFNSLKHKHSSYDFFYLRSLLEPALPHLNSPMPEVMKCVLQLTREAQGDMTSHSLVVPYIDFCANDVDPPQTALTFIENNADLIDLLAPTLIAGARQNLDGYHVRAIELTKDPEIRVRQRAVHALGQIQYSENMSLARSSIEAISLLIGAETDDLLLGNAIKAVFGLQAQHKGLNDELTNTVSTALERGSEFTLYAAVEYAAFNSADIPHNLLTVMLKHFETISANNGGTVHMVDFAIRALLSRNDPTKGILLLEKLLTANKGALEVSSFKSVLSEIQQSQTGLLNKLATRWFASGNYYLGRAITHLVQHDDQKPQLSVVIDELPKEKGSMPLFLARKAAGFLFFSPISAATFIVSLLSLTTNKKTHDALRGVLFDTLMINYPGPMTELLNSLSNTHVAPMCNSILAEYDDYVESIKTVGLIAEHRPPLANKEAYRKQFAEELGDAIQKAQEQSILLSMVKKTVLLYGRKWISYTDIPDQPTQRHESPLHSLETTMDIPRMQNIDPVGLDYMLRVFRNEKLV